MVNIDFKLTETEADSLAQIMDLAVKAGGLHTAVIAVPLFQKLQAAVLGQQKTAPTSF